MAVYYCYATQCHSVTIENGIMHPYEVLMNTIEKEYEEQKKKGKEKDIQLADQTSDLSLPYVIDYEELKKVMEEKSQAVAVSPPQDVQPDPQPSTIHSLRDLSDNDDDRDNYDDSDNYDSYDEESDEEQPEDSMVYHYSLLLPSFLRSFLSILKSTFYAPLSFSVCHFPFRLFG